MDALVGRSDKPTLHEVRAAIAFDQPKLRAGADDRGIVVRGRYLVHGNGAIPDPAGPLAEFDVKIVLPERYPDQEPKVYEVGGRIERCPDRHINPHGDCCVTVWEHWLITASDHSFAAFLRGPVNEFFLGQYWYEKTGEWLFGEWPHGPTGLEEAYAQAMGIPNRESTHPLPPEAALSRLAEGALGVSLRQRQTAAPLPCGPTHRPASAGDAAHGQAHAPQPAARGGDIESDHHDKDGLRPSLAGRIPSQYNTGADMPLRCLDPADRSIHAFDLSDEAWRALARENRKARHLRMPCCAAALALKRSSRGKPFFAHLPGAACPSAGETEAHRTLKAMAVEAARAHGWTAATEEAGLAPSGERWQADVLARRGRHLVALEVQWSKQPLDEIKRRQERYRASGIRGLWLLRRGGIPATRELPAAAIGGSLEGGFQATIDTGIGEQTLPMPSFLDAVFASRFRFGLPPEGAALVSVRAGSLFCWKCGAETRIVTGIDVDLDRGRLAFTVPTLGEHPGPLEDVLDRLPSALGIGAIRRRYSGTQGRSYMSNGCRHCGVLLGEYHEYEALGDQETVLEFPIRIGQAWRRALEEHDGFEPGWSIRPTRMATGSG